MGAAQGHLRPGVLMVSRGLWGWGGEWGEQRSMPYVHANVPPLSPSGNVRSQTFCTCRPDGEKGLTLTLHL